MGGVPCVRMRSGDINLNLDWVSGLVGRWVGAAVRILMELMCAPSGMKVTRRDFTNENEATGEVGMKWEGSKWGD